MAAINQYGPGPDMTNSLGWLAYPWDPKAVEAMYQELLGRTPGPDDYAAHLGNPKGLPGIREAILASPEYRTRQQSLQNTGGGSTGGGGGGGGSTSSSQPFAPSGPIAPAGHLRFAGFDLQRNLDPTKSAKDTFYMAAQRATWMPKTHEEAAKWFEEFIKGPLEQMGYRVLRVDRDKALVATRENPGGEWIDFLIDAGGVNPTLGWQSFGPYAGGMTTGGGTTAGGGTPTGTGTTTTAPPSAPTTAGALTGAQAGQGQPSQTMSLADLIYNPYDLLALY